MVLDNKKPPNVESAELTPSVPLDSEKDQMAVVGDFTSSKELLSRAVSKMKFRKSARVLDALSARIRDGFGNAIYRRVILLLTTGFDGGSRENERDVIRLALALQCLDLRDLNDRL